MEITVNGNRIKLDDNDVRMAQKLTNSFVESIKHNAVAHNRVSMYLTTMVVLHVTSGDILKSLDADVMQALAGKITDKGGSTNG